MGLSELHYWLVARIENYPRSARKVLDRLHIQVSTSNVSARRLKLTRESDGSMSLQHPESLLVAPKISKPVCVRPSPNHGIHLTDFPVDGDIALNLGNLSKLYRIIICHVLEV